MEEKTTKGTCKILNQHSSYRSTPLYKLGRLWVALACSSIVLLQNRALVCSARQGGCSGAPTLFRGEAPSIHFWTIPKKSETT